jgi:beta-galactosidase/beta-glucuronidase
MTYSASTVRRLRSLSLVLLIATTFPSLVSATEKIDLNSPWLFRVDPKSEGESQSWFKMIPTGTERVSVPHTWNIGKYDDYEGVAWYFRTFDLTALTPQKHVELHFAATFYLSRVWVNGAEAGKHEGGHTEYFFDITKLLKPGQNTIAVELDNRPSETSIPNLALKLKSGGNIWYDWWHYGGIVRDVWLAENEGVLIRRQQIRSDVDLARNSAQLKDAVYLENSSGKPQKLSVTAHLFAPDGSDLGNKTQSVTLAAGAKQPVELSFAVDKLQLWDLDHANLYSIRASVSDASNHLQDQNQDTFGNRKIEIHDRHLYINGQQVRLAGMTRHEESPWEGLAETAGTIKHDYDDLKILHTALTRPVHYPQHQQIFEYADTHGILFVPEIPIWQARADQLGNPRFIALARQMLAEMIEQSANHPSIFAWSVCNESDMSTDEGRAYFKQIKALVNQLDPTRFVTFADNDISYGADPKKEAANDADFIMMNQYYGAWNGPEDGLVKMLEHAGSSFPDKMFIISEFGTPGVFATNTVEADKLRVHILHHQLDLFAKYDWIAGAIFWCYQDYKSHRNLWPGHTEGYVDHGVVDEYRQRRPSFFAWEKRTAPATLNAKWKYVGWYRTGGFEVTTGRKPLSELPSYPLKDYKLHWEYRDGEGKLLQQGDFALADMDETQTLHADWPTDPDIHHASLHLVLTNPRAEIQAQQTLRYLFPVASGQDIPDMTLPAVKP